MATKQLLLQLPEELVDRLEQTVPRPGQNAFVQHLLEQALPLPTADSALYEIGVAVERDATLATEMADWDMTVGDGLGRHE